MFILPKYFNNNDYLDLNLDVLNHIIDKNQHNQLEYGIHHYLNHGHIENRKYNKLININYPLKLHMIDCLKLNYSYWFDLLIDFKTNSQFKNQLINDMNELTNIPNYLFVYHIIKNSYSLIDNGIYCERSLIKYYSKNIYDILHDVNLQSNIMSNTQFNMFNNMSNSEFSNVLDLNAIFKIENKFRFFYEYLKYHTNFVKNTEFDIFNSASNTKTAVIIETRNHIMFEHIVYNVMYNLGPEWNLHIFCGYDNFDFVKLLFPKVKITLLPFYNLSVNIYDFICLNSFFWNSIDTEDILIFQTDVFLTNNINHILNNNCVYLGAPHTNIHGNISYLTPNKFGFNGGLSLRKKSIMLYCINNITAVDIDNYRSNKNMKPIIRTPIDITDIDFEYIITNFTVSDFDVSITQTQSEYLNLFNLDLIYEDVYFSHAIEMLNFPLPNIYLSKHFALQENMYGPIYDVCGIHGWDKNYMTLDYHKQFILNYTSKLFNSDSNLSSSKLTNLIMSDNSSSNNIKLNAKITRILIICHNMKGGTEKYVRDIIELTKSTYLDQNLEFDFIRIKKSNSESTSLTFNNINYKLVKKSPTFLSKSYDIIHIHYFNEPAFILYNFIVDLLNSTHPKFIITLHDYHLIVNDETNDYHLTVYNSNPKFLDSIKMNNKYSVDKYSYLLSKADLILTGSSVLKIIYNYVFDLSDDKIKIVQHPEPIYFTSIDQSKLNFNKLNICLIGSISITKGSYIAQDMSLLFKNNVQLYHIGYGYNYNIKKKNNIISLGNYSNEYDFKQMLIQNNINLLWFPAYRHESYCYTLTLAMNTSLPILALDSGTFNERLSGYQGFYKIHHNYDLKSMYDDIMQFWNDLINNTHINSSNVKFIYDDFDYNVLYKLK